MSEREKIDHRKPLEEHFSQALKELWKTSPLTSFEEALFGEELNVERPQVSLPKGESLQVMQQLGQFVQETVEQTLDVHIPIKGGEIELKSPLPEKSSLILARLDSVVLAPQPSRLVVVGPMEEGAHSGEGRQLLDKMISAMKLAPGEGQILLAPHATLQNRELLYSQVYSLRPEFVILLGGMIGQIFLQMPLKLQEHHGQFYSRQILCQDKKSLSFQVIPIFHPDYLLINPKMKKTAWEDLQKVMRAMGKI